MKLYAELVENENERELFVNKILVDYEYGFNLIAELLGEVAEIRRKGQYDNLKWRNSKLEILHKLHIIYLKQWRKTNDQNSIEKDEMLTKLLSIINSLSSGVKNTG